VPLWSDAGTLDGLTAWNEFRQSLGARFADHFICWLQRATFGVDGGSKWRRGTAEFGGAVLVKVSERQEWCVAEEL